MTTDIPVTEAVKEDSPQKKQYQECLPKLGLEFNTRVFIKFASLSSNVPLQGEFLGTSHYEFLILRLPSVPGLIKKLIPQTVVEIRYQFEGADSSFMAEIISHATKPAMLLFVTYPDRLTIQEARKHQRLVCSLPTRLATPYGEAVSVMKDLSQGGCRVALELTGQSNLRRLVEGDRIVLHSAFSVTTEPVRGLALVRNVDLVGTRMSVGMSFDKSGKEFSEAVTEYLTLIKTLS